jgi:hypothetical protein
MNKILIISALFIAVLIPQAKKALAVGSAGTSGAEFLLLGIGSRPIAMGEAFTAMGDDINSIYFNPSGLATMKMPVLSLMHQELRLDSRFENISAAFPLFQGFAGVSSSVYWVEPFNKYDIDGNKSGSVYFLSASGVFAYGQSIGFMEVGGSVKYIYQRIDTLNVNSAAIDLGIMKRLYMYSPFDAPAKNFSFGLAVQNIGTAAKDDPLPRTIRIGSSYYLTRFLCFNIDMIESFIHSSDLYDFTYGFDESFRINAGLELNYLNIIFLRGGYRFNDSGTYSFGLGFNYQVQNVSCNVDAAYSDSGALGASYSFTVSFKLLLKVITVEDMKKAEKFYQEGIRSYVNDDIDTALDNFEKCRDYNRYYKNIDQKIKEIKELKRLRKENEDKEKK